ncbi:alpha-mannosidase [Gemmatimonadota bacterium]
MSGEPAGRQPATAANGRMVGLAIVLVVLIAVALSTFFLTSRGPDLSIDPTLYVVGYAHLDTQWRWDYVRTIGDYIPRTMHDNFALFRKYPHYVFNFSGANRYRMMKEYYPDDYERVKRYVAAGRWFPSGSAMEESDVNVPSAESLVRQILYGTQFFRREFGKTSAEYMLPDCFGFPASLPTILSHSGITGFSTQKLSWNSAAGIPFNIGVWEGLDGSSVIAALNPLSYGSQIREDLSKSEEWQRRVRENGERGGVLADYHYYGTGDTGGSPRESSVEFLEAIVTGSEMVIPPERPRGQRGEPEQPVPEPGPPVQMGDGPLNVISATSEQMFLDITEEQRAGLPRYRGDLLLIEHSAGSITSQTYMKRWNRHGEVLADAAERASVAAAWLGGRSYPLKRLNDAWTLVMGGQFHDILPGTSIPKAYEYSWNDAVLAMNQFAGVVESATEAIASGMDTRTEGIPVVVYNPLSIEREDVVEATLYFQEGTPPAIRVIGPEGNEVPAQVVGEEGGGTKVLFLARVPSVGFAVYDVQRARSQLTSTLQVTPTSLENNRYRVRMDRNGDIASIFDKTVGRELLSSPSRLAFQHNRPAQWPAWNMDWSDQQQPPRAYVGGPARVRIAENGPARVALEVDRQAEGSRFVQQIRLAAGDAGNRVEIANVIDWQIGETALKATFPLTASNPMATYNWEVGTIQRGNNDSTKYEVPSHQWFDLTDRSGEYGVTVLTDCKYGSDKPDDSMLRLTLIYSPGITRSYPDQATQDWGHHEFVYGLAGHAGSWRREKTDWQALRLNQPMMAFESPWHDGALGKSFSLLSVSNDRVRVQAVKRAEEGDEVIVRLVEVDGAPASDVRVAFAGPVRAAREVNGQERPIGRATVRNGELVTDMGPYQLRAFALRLGPAPADLGQPGSRPVLLPFDRSVASRDSTPTEGGFDAEGRSLPAEMLPREIPFAGITFRLAPSDGPEPNAVTARGQEIPLPGSDYRRVYILAASAGGDRTATFHVGDESVELTIQDWGGYIGQWDNRIWDRVEVEVPADPERNRPARTRATEEYGGLTPGFIKPAPVAWFASHRHTADGVNEPYSYAYLFAYAIDMPEGAESLTLPDDGLIRILAVTVSDEDISVLPAHPLYDTMVRAGGH